MLRKSRAVAALAFVSLFSTGCSKEGKEDLTTEADFSAWKTDLERVNDTMISSEANAGVLFETVTFNIDGTDVLFSFTRITKADGYTGVKL